MNLDLNLLGELMKTLGETSYRGEVFRARIDVTDTYVYLRISKFTKAGDMVASKDKTFAIDTMKEPRFMFHEAARLAGKLIREEEARHA